MSGLNQRSNIQDMLGTTTICGMPGLPLFPWTPAPSVGSISEQSATSGTETILDKKPRNGLPTEDQLRKALPILTYLTEYFPDATLAEVAVSVAGNQQHNPGQPLHWAREKSKDQLNTAFRHLWDHKMGIKKDTDGQYHLAKAIWRLKAELQLTIEKDNGTN